MRSPLTAILFLAAAIALPAAITACSVGGEEDTSSGEEALKKGKEGAACNFTNKLCKAGLVCKMKQVGSGSSSSSGGPPPGAVGMPAPSDSTSSSTSSGSTSGGPPPGAVGLPAPQSCPPSGAIIDCMPVTTNPNCASARRDWIEANCPDVSFLD